MSSVDRLNASYDAVVVGARCAGASTAMLLARAGANVLAVDRSARGEDTLSTLALMRAGVMQLHRWGLLEGITAASTPAFRATTFHYGDEVIAVPIKPRDGVDALYAPRRTVLDPLLVAAAEGSGAAVVHGLRLADLTRGPGGNVSGVVVQDRSGRRRSIRAGIVIGADGQRSAVARLVGAERYRSGAHAAGVVYALWPWTADSGNEWRYRPGVSVGIIPTNHAVACVFVAVPADRFARELQGDMQEGYRRLLHEGAPDLAARLRGSTPAGRLWGFAGTPGYFRQSWGDGWALVGDAGYFKDPITAHGITDALRDAELLARAVLEGSSHALEHYQAVRDELSVGVFETTDRIASFDWSLPDLQALHRTLSEQMQHEVVWLRQLGAPVARRGAGVCS